MSIARELAELGGSYGSGGFVGMKNRIINGAMTVAQRGTSGTVGTGGAAWILDRWQHRPSSSVGGTTTWSQVFDTTTGVTKLRLNYSSATSSAYFQQKIEAQYITDLWGGSVTLTFFSSDSLVTVDVYSYDASGTEATLQSNVAPTSLGSNKYQLTFTCTTPAGGIRTGNELGMIVVIKPKGGATPSNSTNYDYWNIQLEKGSVATSFDYRPYGTELALCQRYYYRQTRNSDADAFIGMGALESSTAAGGVVRHPVPMRASPTGSISGAINFATNVAYTGTNSISNTGNLTAYVVLTTTGGTAGQGGRMYFNAGGNYLDMNAEL